MVRRRIAAVVAVVIVIIIVLVINGIVSSQKASALQSYNQDVNQIAHESGRTSKQLFSALAGASGKPAINVAEQINQLHSAAQLLAERAKDMGVPGGMVEAQRNLVLVLDLRSEGLAKIGGLVRTALGGKAKSASTQIAGDMEIFSASDVIFSQRVKPLIAEGLKDGGVTGQTASSTFLPNLGWLMPETVLGRITGQTGEGESAESGALAPGTHGDALQGVSVSGATLEAEPSINHLAGGGNPTFTLTVQNTGENTETDIKAEVTVRSAVKHASATHTIDKLEAGETVNVDIPVSGISTGVESKVQVKIHAVPGETNLENNEATYIAMFE